MSTKRKKPVSENIFEKQPRGRPRLLADREVQVLRMYDGPRTMRTHQNRWYMVHAQYALHGTDGDGERFKYLIDVEDRTSAEQSRPAYKQTILQEVGRLWVPESIRLVADAICKRKLNTRQAVALIRFVRLGWPARKSAQSP